MINEIAIKKLKSLRCNAWKYYPESMLSDIHDSLRIATIAAQTNNPVELAVEKISKVLPDATLIHEGDKWKVSDLLSEIHNHSISGDNYLKEVTDRIFKELLEEAVKNTKQIYQVHK
jgi:hypothetical protein